MQAHHACPLHHEAPGTIDDCASTVDDGPRQNMQQCLTVHTVLMSSFPMAASVAHGS